MYKSLLLLFCFSNLISLHLAVEYYDGAEKDYSSNEQTSVLSAFLSKSLSRLQSDSTFKDESLDSLLDFRNNSTNSTACADDVKFILDHIKELWALRFIDSFGKPESGILQGNFKWVGDYNECVQFRSTNSNSSAGNFRGKYCSLTWLLPSALNVSTPFTTGLCVPDSCSTKELQVVLDNSTHIGSMIFNDPSYDVITTITCKPTERHWNAPAIAVIFFLSIFVALAVVGSSITAVKYFKNSIETSQDTLIQSEVSKDQANGFGVKLQAFLDCFCMFTNGAKLLNTDSSEGQLLCVHGIRFLSMSWVILGHTYAVPYLGALRNQLEALNLINTLPFQVVIQAFYAVDSFFVLSGFLLTYLAMKEFAKTKGSISWTQFYIHRYVRLTPVYMLILGFSTSVYFYLGSGPFWTEPEGNFDFGCRKSWWMNLLYINNFSKKGQTCMEWSWYLANDMQFFVISPLFLITLWWWPKIGYSLIAAFLAETFIANFAITYHYEFNAGLTGVIGIPDMADFAKGFAKNNEYTEKIYIKPYTRIGPYLIGILVGYLLFKRKASSNPKHSLLFICSGWIIAAAVTLPCVYGLYNTQPTVLASSFYNAVHRTCFGAGLCWVIYVCLIGQGGIVDSILSCKFFIPLSRLTYSAYLIHPMVVLGYFNSLKTTFEFFHPSTVYLFLGIMVITYSLALPIALILESPIVSLEKLLRKSFSKKENS